MNKRNGFFLVLVLIVIVVASLSVYSFTGLMVAYDDAAYLMGDLVQARVAGESGAEAVRLILSQPPDMRVDLGGVYNNPNLFQAITVSTGIDGATPCNYSIIAPDLDELGLYGGLRFGLQNESAKLNINALTVIEENWQGLAPIVAVTGAEEEASSDNIAALLLLGLPGMTEDVANAIMDWLDEDDIERDNGAEADYYNGLSPPYQPADGPIQSVEELLLVKGVTPTLLFGADANRNGLLDADEQQRFNVSVDTAGALGWAAYLTVHSAEANKRRDGSFRINVNQDDLELLADELEELGNDDYASFILAYRIAGQSAASAMAAAVTGEQEVTTNNNTPNTPTGIWNAGLLDQFDLSGGGGTKLNQVLDLVGATVTVGQGDQQQTYASPFGEDPISMAIYMPLLMDYLTTQDTEMMPGRINLNQCPAELLYGMGLLTEEQVEAIIEEREVETDDPNRNYETWPMVEGILTLNQMRQVMPLLTGGGDVYRAQIIGYFEGTGASHRSDVIIDATTVNPKIVLWRDLSHLGRGFELSVLGMRSTLGLAPPPQ